MDVRIIFAPVTHTAAEVVATRLVYKASGELFDNWRALSSNRDIIAAAGMNFHNQIFGLRFSIRDQSTFLVQDTHAKAGQLKGVIFHIVWGGYTDDPGSYMHWIDISDKNGIASLALPLTIDPDFFNGWVGNESEDVRLRQVLLQYVVNAYSAASTNWAKQRLRTVYVCVDPKLQRFETDVMQIWRELQRRDMEG